MTAVMRESPRPVPVPTPETANMWAGTRVGELRYQRCRACGHPYLPPQRLCPECSAADIEVLTSAGTGTVLSAIVSHLDAPGFAPPYVIAVIELDEGARLMSNVVGVEAQLGSVPPGTRVVVAFEAAGDQVLPVFTPVPHL